MYRKSGESGSGCKPVDRAALVEADSPSSCWRRRCSKHARRRSVRHARQRRARAAVAQTARCMRSSRSLTAGAGLVKTGDAVAITVWPVDAANLVPGQGGLIGCGLLSRATYLRSSIPTAVSRCGCAKTAWCSVGSRSTLRTRCCPRQPRHARRSPESGSDTIRHRRQSDLGSGTLRETRRLRFARPGEAGALYDCRDR